MKKIKKILIVEIIVLIIGINIIKEVEIKRKEVKGESETCRDIRCSEVRKTKKVMYKCTKKEVEMTDENFEDGKCPKQPNPTCDGGSKPYTGCEEEPSTSEFYCDCYYCSENTAYYPKKGYNNKKDPAELELEK